MEAGLAVVFMVDPLGAQQSMTIPQVMVDQCKQLGISPTGNAAGKMSVTDLSGAPHGPVDQYAAGLFGWCVDSLSCASLVSDAPLEFEKLTRWPG